MVYQLNEQQIAEFIKVFKIFNEDGSGTIDI